MSKTLLKLRSRPMIAFAYILGPFIGMNAWYAAKVIPAMLRPDFNPEGAATGWFITLLFGGLACIAIELVAVTPLLVFFNRYRWSWLNGWSAASIGFLIGALPWFFLEASHPPSDTSGSVTTCAHGHCTVEGWAKAGLGSSPTLDHSTLFADGHWTSSGWIGLVGDAVMVGMVGLIVAVVIRLVAMHKIRLPD